MDVEAKPQRKKKYAWENGSLIVVKIIGISIEIIFYRYYVQYVDICQTYLFWNDSFSDILDDFGPKWVLGRA